MAEVQPGGIPNRGMKKSGFPICTLAVFEIALSTLADIRSTNELTFGGPALILVDRRNMQ